MERIGNHIIKKDKIQKYLEENEIKESSDLFVENFLEMLELSHVGVNSVKKILEAYILENNNWITSFDVLKLFYTSLSIDSFWDDKKISDLDFELLNNYKTISTACRRKQFFVKIHEYVLWVGAVKNIDLKDSYFSYKNVIYNIQELENHLALSQEQKQKLLDDTKFNLQIPKSFEIKLESKDFKNILELVLGISNGNFEDFSGVEYKTIRTKFNLSFKEIEDLKEQIETIYTGDFLLSKLMKDERKFNVFKMRFEDKMTLTDIGKKFGFSRERARQLSEEMITILSMDFYVAMINKMLDYHVYPHNFITKETLDEIFNCRKYISNYIYLNLFPVVLEERLAIYHFGNENFINKFKIELEKNKKIEKFLENVTGSQNKYFKTKDSILEWMKRKRYYIYGDYYFKGKPSMTNLVTFAYSEGIAKRPLGLDEESEEYIKNVLKIYFNIKIPFNWKGVYTRLFSDDDNVFMHIDTGKIQYIENIGIQNDLITSIREKLLGNESLTQSGKIEVKYLYENLGFKKLGINNSTFLYSIIKKYCSDIVVTSDDRGEDISFTENYDDLETKFNKLFKKNDVVDTSKALKKLVWTKTRFECFMHNTNRYLFWTGDTICRVDYIKLDQKQLVKIEEILNKKYSSIFPYMVEIKKANIIEKFDIDTPRKFKKVMKYNNLSFASHDVEFVSLSKDFEFISRYIVKKLILTEKLYAPDLVKFYKRNKINRTTFSSWKTQLEELNLLTE